MTTLMENPFPIILVGVLAVAVCAVALVRTGRGIFLVAIGGIALLTLAGVLVEKLVVTQREEVEQVIDDAAAAVRANRLEGVLERLSPDAARARDLIRWAFGRATFEDVRLTRLEIRVINTASPPLAKAEITGYVRCRDRLGEYPYDAVPIDGTLELRKIDSRWLVTGYEMRQDPRGH